MGVHWIRSARAWCGAWCGARWSHRAAFCCREVDLETGQARFCTLPPACVFVFCLHRHSLPPARVLCFVRRTSEHTASHTALRALTDPASLSKDASVSNEQLEEIALEAHVNSLFDDRSDSDSECVERSVVLAPGNTKDQQNEQPKAGCSKNPCQEGGELCA